METTTEINAADVSETSEQAISPTAAGFAWSYAITSLASAILVVLKETFKWAHDLLVTATGHHWTAQGAVVVLLFVILGFVLMQTSMARTANAGQLIGVVVGSTIISGLIIGGYFLI